MDWKMDYEELKRVLSLEGRTVTVAYSNEKLGGDETPRAACKAIQDAKDGTLVVLSRENSTCFGGNDSLGFPSEGLRPKTREEMLVEMNLRTSIAVAKGQEASLPPAPIGLGKYVIFSPPENAFFVPHLVLFVVNPIRATRIMGLLSYDLGRSSPLYVGGCTCKHTIGNPIVTGEPGISFICSGGRSRASFGDDDLIISLPFSEFRRAARNINGSRYGRAKPAQELWR